MSWLLSPSQSEPMVQASIAAIEFALNWMVQSTLLIIIGVFAARLLSRRGSAAQSVVYRTTLVATLVCPLATVVLSMSGISGWSIDLPSGYQAEQANEPLARADASPSSARVQAVTEQTPWSDVIPAPGSNDNPRLAFNNLIGTGTIEPPPVEEITDPSDDVMQALTPADATEIEVSALGLVAMFGSLLWLMISAILLARLCIAWRSLARLRRRAQPIDAETAQACRDLAMRLNVSVPAMMHSPYVPSPCLAGLWRPAILLPEESSPIPLHDVLVHELAHLRRHDCHWNLLRHVSEAILFFQPLLWLLSRRIESSAEEVCDDFVVELGADRAEYANRLVEVAELSSAPMAQVGVGIVSLRSMLSRRVQRIMNTSRRLSTQVGNLVLTLVLIGGLAAAVTSGLIGLAPAPADTPDESAVTVDGDVERRESAEEASAGKLAGAIVKGVVLDPNGKPLKGATVEAQLAFDPDEPEPPVATTTTRDRGRFEIKIPDDGFFTLVANHDRYAADYLIGSRDTLTSTEDTTLRLVHDDMPIRGRVVDLEGNPIFGVKVTVRRLNASGDENLDDWLQAIDQGQVIQDANYKILKGPASLHPDSLPDTVITDRDGSFSLHGVGRERQVHLHFAGDTITYTRVTVVTRDMEPVVANDEWSKTHTVYGATFELAIEPTRPIEGVVRDADNGNPLPGVEVAYAMRAHGRDARPFVRTISDEQGRYRLAGMPKDPGEYEQILVRPSIELPYLMRRFDVPDQPGFDPINLDLELHRGVWISGRVIEETTGQPVRGRNVFAQYYPYRSNPFAQALPEFENKYFESHIYHLRYRVGADGRYRMLGLPGKAIVGVAIYDGSYPRGQGSERIEGANEYGDFPTYGIQGPASKKSPTIMREVDIREGTKEFPVDFSVESGRVIHVTATAPDGTAIGRLTTINVAGRSSTRNSSESAFDVLGLGASEERTLIIHDQANRRGRVLQVSGQDSPDEITVNLEPCVTIRGRLVDDNETPISGARVIFNPRPGGSFSPSLEDTSTNKEGRFECDCVLPGANYDVLFMSFEQRSGTLAENLEISPGETIDLGTIDVTSDERPEPMRTDVADRSAEAALSNPGNKSAVTATERALSEVGKATERAQATGLVVDDEGWPVPNATVSVVRWRWPGDAETITQTESDADGQFEFLYPSSLLDSVNPHERPAYIVAHRNGFGSDGISIRRLRAEQELQLVLAHESAPLTGRLIDLEGRPIAGATVKPRSYHAPKSGELSDWIKAVENGEPPWTSSSHLRYLPLVDPQLTRQITTDAEGRFRMTGVGDERKIDLVFEGSTITRTVVEVVTRELDPLSHSERIVQEWSGDKKSIVVGTGFELAVSPTRVIQGVVRDAETGEPMASVGVQSWRFSETHTGGGARHIRTETDSEGRFEMIGMPKGAGNEIVAVPNDQQPYVMRVAKVPNPPGLEPAVVDVELHRGLWITGKATDKSTGEPVVGASLHYLPFRDNKFANELPEFDSTGNVDGFQTRYLTDADGNYRLVGLPGRAIVGIVAMNGEFRSGLGVEMIQVINERGKFDTYLNPMIPGRKWPHSVREIDPTPGTKAVHLDLQLDPGKQVTVALKAPDGTPLREVNVSFLAPAETRTALFHDEERNLGKAAQISASNSQPIIVTLEPNATVVGQLIDNSGEAVTGAKVEFFINPIGDFSPDLQSVVTDSHGRFEHRCVIPSETYTMRIESTQVGFRRITGNLEVSPGEQIDLGTIDVTSDERPEPVRAKVADRSNDQAQAENANRAEANGTVVDTEGRPISGAEVYFAPRVISRRETCDRATRAMRRADSISTSPDLIWNDWLKVYALPGAVSASWLEEDSV